MDTNHIKATIEEKQAEEFTAIASSSVVDRQGEVIDPAGFDFRLPVTSPAVDRGVVI